MVVLVLPLPLLEVLCWWRLMVIALLDIEGLLLSALEDVRVSHLLQVLS